MVPSIRETDSFLANRRVRRYASVVEKVVTIHHSHREAEQADNEYYRRLTPEQRLDILLALINPEPEEHGPQSRLERVYRIVELSRS